MNELIFVVTPQNGGWSIEAEVSDSSSLPKDIFLYENTGVDILGSFVGVTSCDELYRSPLWTGEQLPKFGNRYVKYNSAKITVKDKSEVEAFIANVTSSIKLLKQQLDSLQSYTVTVQI